MDVANRHVSNALSPKKQLAPAAFLSPLKAARRKPLEPKDFDDLREPPPPLRSSREPLASSRGDDADARASRSLWAVASSASIGANYAVPSTPSSNALPGHALKTQRGDGAPSNNSNQTQQQIALETALANHADERARHDAKAQAVEVKRFQFEQMQLKQQRKSERKLDDKVLLEQLAWEQAQLALADEHQQAHLLWQRTAMREAHAHALELARRRHTVAAMTKSFCDKLAVLPALEAMAVFLEKREQLLECCMHQYRNHVDPSELESVQTEIHEMVAKVHSDLQYRVRSHEREERMKAAKQRALLALQQSHLDQIQHHASAADAERHEHVRTRAAIVRDQDALDRRYHAREAARKQQALAHGAKLVEQIRNNEDARASVPIAVHGSSPLCRTPWWSDESDERTKIYDTSTARQLSTGAATTASSVRHDASPPRTSHGKKTSRWYD